MKHSSRSARHIALTRRRALALGVGPLLAWLAPVRDAAAQAKTAVEIEAGVDAALRELFDQRPDSLSLYQRASGVLVFPEILKAGVILGGAYGEGALLIGGRTESYWSYGAASIGYQIGAQTTRLALFFLTDAALDAFRSGPADGFEFGADAELTVLEAGAEVGVDTTTDRDPVVAIAFSRAGLLGGVSLQGGKYSRIER